ncbi:MAG TPA: MFS transporter [Gammaproteobacteria bacterium]|nr:MFS transporter [Gammaproteobacteria bacterium]
MLDAERALHSWREDARVIGCVGLAHLVSHFFQLLLPPLLPWVKAEFGLSFAALGFVMTVLFVVSGVTQMLAGFVVDRLGPAPTLAAGLACFVAAALVLATATGYPLLLVGAALSGIGNGVFHPVDYSLLNHRVHPSRLGHAYSVHGLTGSLGWALAPVFLVGLAVPFGWRASLCAAALLPIAVALLLLANRGLFRPLPQETAATAAAPVRPLAFLREPAIWWCFVFFAIVAAAASAVQNFAPTVFTALFHVGLTEAALSITVFMLASAAGMFVGGWLVHRQRRLERNIALAFGLSAIAATLIGLAWLTPALAFVAIAAMGFGSGLAGPSRDMLIRSATPRGATGRVYGVVYSGLDLGIAVGPVVFGRLLDAGRHGAVFLGVAGLLLVAMLTAAGVAARTPAVP